jgi:dienelactone hydrolase
MLSFKQERRSELFRLLGDLPPVTKDPIPAKLVLEEEREGYVLEKLVLYLNGAEPVPAYFVKPKHIEGPTPVILYNHAHGGLYEVGKDELLNGTDYLQQPSYAVELTKMGFSALCIDMWGFGDRYGHGKTESEYFKEMLWNGQVLWGMMVYDSLQAARYLASRPDVDAERIGTLGISMGSTMAWWVAALEPRIKVCVDMCCMTDFHSLIETRRLDAHGVYYYVPGLLKHFTTAQINALIAPRPHLSLNGIYDTLTPPGGLEKIDKELRGVYAEEGAPEAWEMKSYGVGHRETPEMRCEIIRFLHKWL